MPTSQNSASRIEAPSQGSTEKPRSAANVPDTAAAESNAPAQVSQTQISQDAAGPANSKETTTSTWQWNPKGAANSPATLGQSEDRISENESTSAASPATPDDVQNSDPSRAAWLQGTIDNVHSTSAPVQR